LCHNRIEMAERLTSKQTRLLAEREDLAALFGMDYANIGDYEREARTPMLAAMKKQAYPWASDTPVHPY
jgi:hypothetical protein